MGKTKDQRRAAVCHTARGLLNELIQTEAAATHFKQPLKNEEAIKELSGVYHAELWEIKKRCCLQYNRCTRKKTYCKRSNRAKEEALCPK